MLIVSIAKHTVIYGTESTMLHVSPTTCVTRAKTKGKPTKKATAVAINWVLE